MEVFRDDSWEKLPVLPEDYGFIEIAYELEPGESRFMDIDFAWLYGELQKGKYKMIKKSICQTEEYIRYRQNLKYNKT